MGWGCGVDASRLCSLGNGAQQGMQGEGCPSPAGERMDAGAVGRQLQLLRSLWCCQALVDGGYGNGTDGLGSCGDRSRVAPSSDPRSGGLREKG